MSCKWFLFTGTPGTGKSQLIKALINAYGVNPKNILQVANARDYVKKFDQSVHTDVICEGGVSADEYKLLLTLYPHPRRFFVTADYTLEEWASNDEMRLHIRTHTHCLWESSQSDVHSQKARLFVRSDATDSGSIVEIQRYEGEQQPWAVQSLLERLCQ